MNPHIVRKGLFNTDIHTVAFNIQSLLKYYSQLTPFLYEKMP